jgi:hypothetical protein
MALTVPIFMKLLTAERHYADRLLYRISPNSVGKHRTIR